MAAATHQDESARAELGPRGLGLSARLAALIDPRVLAERHERIVARLEDTSGAAVLQRRCAEVVANYLLDAYAND